MSDEDPAVALPDVTLVFGVGAQKAGTTWLYDWLATHPEVHMPRLNPESETGSIKEVHYFDAFAKGSNQRWRMTERYAKVAEGAAALAGKRGPKLARRIARLRRQLDLLEIFAGEPGDHSRYLRWMTRGAEGKRVVPDISPAYALLGRETFAEMAALMPRTRFVFIMRDPVDRLWSSVRMAVESDAGPDSTFEQAAHQQFARALGSGRLEDTHRSNYELTIAELEAAVPRAHIYYGFFENLFVQGTADEITAFLGIGPHPADTGTPSNAGRPAKLTDDLAAEAYRVLRPQYDFAAAKFGDALPKRWRDRMAAFATAG